MGFINKINPVFFARKQKRFAVNMIHTEAARMYSEFAAEAGRALEERKFTAEQIKIWNNMLNKFFSNNGKNQTRDYEYFKSLVLNLINKGTLNDFDWVWIEGELKPSFEEFAKEELLKLQVDEVDK